jgi:hypothetical protein
MQLDFFYEIIAGQDYRMAAGIQRMLGDGVGETFLLGRCEVLTQAMHADFERLTAARP